ncbi:kinase/pyrophosphorylase [Paenibacillus sp. S150]|nr:kinase/pyrophosphorylase [Paenibacillus sp. S150]
MEILQEKWILICSDAVGETAESVVNAALRQFNTGLVRIKRFSHITGEREIREAVRIAAERNAPIIYTISQPGLNHLMVQEAGLQGVQAVDVMSPVTGAISSTFAEAALNRQTLEHRLNESYYRRVEAMEFAVKYDDGKDPRGLMLAEIVLIGVSRTSKTPLSIYMAHKGYKVANYPLTPESKAPAELFRISNRLIFGLTMDLDSILKIRMERLRSLGLNSDADYAAGHRIVEEFEYAETLMKKLGCRVINVTDKSIEETSGLIIDCLQGV